MKPDTSAIDGIIYGRVDPRIYAFTTGTVPDYLKVGDTCRPVAVRLREWARRYENLQKQYEHSAKADEGSEVYFRDHEVHDYIARHGCVRLKKEELADGVYFSSEFFRKAGSGDIEDVKQEVVAAIQDIRQDYREQTNRYRFYDTPYDEHHFQHERGAVWPVRANQQEAIDAFCKAIACGRDKLLMYAVMRFGKSFTALCCAKEMDARLVYVVSAKAEVSAEWQKNVEVPGNFDGYAFYTIDKIGKSIYAEGRTIQSLLDDGVRVVVFLTLQDLSGSVEKLKAKHKELFSLAADLTIVDETHFAARAERYGAVLQSEKFTKDSRSDNETADKDEEEAIGNIRCLKRPRVTLHLSGTPYRILMGSEFAQDDIISFCQYNDILEAQKQWNIDHPDKDEWENPYFGFPQMVRFALNPNASARARLEELRSEGYTYAYSELLAPQSTNKDSEGRYKRFKHEREVLEMLQTIDGSRDDDELFGFLDYDKLRDGKMCRHIVCVLPYCASCDALEQLIKDHARSFRNLQDYEIINISGVDAKTIYRKPDDIKHRISECEKLGRKTLTLTVNRMLTGSTVPQWDTMLYLKDTSSPQEYDQAVFRLQSQHVRELKNSCGKTMKIDLKPQTLLVDLNPDRMFHLQAQKSLVYNVNTELGGNNELERRIGRELAVSPIFMLNKDRMQRVEPVDIMDAVSRYSSNRSAVDEAADIEVDTSLMADREIAQIVKTLARANSGKGIMSPAYRNDNATDVDTGGADGHTAHAEGSPAPPSAGSGHVEEADNAENPVADFRQRFRTFYIKLLFYAFLTESDVKSLEDVISSIETAENTRIARHAELNLDLIAAMRAKANKRIMCDLDFAIRRINELANDKNTDKLQRTLTCIRKFDRISTSEIITPSSLVDEMAGIIPAEGFHGNVIDIASKAGEFTVALYQRMKGLGMTHAQIFRRIHALPTSGIAYEFTRKVFEALNLDTRNIITEFTTYDLVSSNNKETYIQKLKDMNLSHVIGNPPYMERQEKTSDSPIYHCLVDVAHQLASATLITPARFLYNAGKTPQEWNRKMLSDRHLKVIWVKPASEVFPLVDIKGGVAVTYRNEDIDFGAIGTYTQYEELRTIMGKVDAMSNGYVSEIVYAPESYKLSPKFHLDNPWAASRLSKGHKNDITSNIFEKIPEVLADAQMSDGQVCIYGRSRSERIYKWINREYIMPHENLDSFKVFLAKSNGTGEFGEKLAPPVTGRPKQAHTQTFISIGNFGTQAEADGLAQYIKTKFFRALLGIQKVTQDNKSSVFRFVPLQDFTPQSDIDWTLPISDIDRKLYEKYGLTPDEQSFIERMVKPME